LVVLHASAPSWYWLSVMNENVVADDGPECNSK
jgi:hypothetical protein